MTIGPLRPEDVGAALALSTAEGWNQSSAEWSRMIGLEPEGCFAAREGDRVVGTVTTTTYGRDLAWIGMMIVDSAFRRRGLGAALMSRALDHLQERGIASVKLDATPAGRPLYERLGFTAERVMERWVGVAQPGPEPGDLESGASPAWFELDRFVYGIDRSRLLQRLVEDGEGAPLAVTGAADLVRGYALARRGRSTVTIGPVIAGDAAVAVQLLDAMLARFAGQEVGLDRHRGGGLAAEVVAARGLTLRRELTRMAWGRPTAAATSLAICASTGPEFG